jgi:hypothetical protein
MTRIKLGARPKNFKRTLQVSLPDGDVGSVQVSYIYRTRTEFGAFVDELMAGLPQTSAPPAGEPLSLAKAMAGNVDQQADYIMRIIDGWDIDQPFDRDHARQLCDELPGIATQIIETYRLAVSEGRLGN